MDVFNIIPIASNGTNDWTFPLHFIQFFHPCAPSSPILAAELSQKAAKYSKSCPLSMTLSSGENRLYSSWAWYRAVAFSWCPA